MPSSWTQNFYHAVFSTNDRLELIAPEVEERLYPFIGGILKDLRCTPYAINGMPDHLHVLTRYPSDLSHADDHPTAHGTDQLLDMIVDKDGNSYAAGMSFNGTTFDLLAISWWFADGARRWVRTDVPPPPPDYVLFNGSGSGDDLGGCIHLDSANDFQHNADVFVFGAGLINAGGSNVLRYILNKYDQID